VDSRSPVLAAPAVQLDEACTSAESFYAYNFATMDSIMAPVPPSLPNTDFEPSSSSNAIYPAGSVNYVSVYSTQTMAPVTAAHYWQASKHSNKKDDATCTGCLAKLETLPNPPPHWNAPHAFKLNSTNFARYKKILTNPVEVACECAGHSHGQCHLCQECNDEHWIHSRIPGRDGQLVAVPGIENGVTWLSQVMLSRAKLVRAADESYGNKLQAEKAKSSTTKM